MKQSAETPVSPCIFPKLPKIVSRGGSGSISSGSGGGDGGDGGDKISALYITNRETSQTRTKDR